MKNRYSLTKIKRISSRVNMKSASWAGPTLGSCSEKVEAFFSEGECWDPPKRFSSSTLSPPSLSLCHPATLFRHILKAHFRLPLESTFMECTSAQILFRAREVFTFRYPREISAFSGISLFPFVLEATF